VEVCSTLMTTTRYDWRRRLQALRVPRQIVACLCLWPLLLSAKCDATEPTVEIKCLVPEANIADLSKKLDLQSKKSMKRVVCFFDTDSLSLFQHVPKVILRSRYDSAHGADTTVKIRDGEVQGADIECEFDEVLGKEKIMSCSLTDKDEEKAQIKKANRGQKINKIFSKEQRALLQRAFGELDWETLRPYGPVKAIEVWKKVRMLDGPDLTIERWEFLPRSNKPGRTLFEVSAKVPLAREAETSKWIAAFVGSPENGDQESETKTRIVLEHFKGTSTKRRNN
jgi:hypothetical protein